MQSSSPSYLLMASLDAARAAAVEPGAWDEPLAAAAAARHAAAELPPLRVLHVDSNGPDAMPALDPLKLTIGVDDLGISGGGHDASCLFCHMGFMNVDLPLICSLSHMGYTKREHTSHEGPLS